MRPLHIAQLLLIFTPVYVSAAPSTFRELVGVFLSIINVLIPFVIGLTIVVFMWKIAQNWVFHGDDQEGITKGKQTALWGVIVLVVMFAVWGILALLQTTLFGNVGGALMF